MGGLLTVSAFLERFPLLNTMTNDTLRNAQIQGTLRKENELWVKTSDRCKQVPS
jgi:hypothetical protein